jgi:diguanylate cyclase (GGDEF)-like protein/PAS domain S-box-containing protein
MPDPTPFQPPSTGAFPSTSDAITAILGCITEHLGVRTSYLTAVPPTRDHVAVTAAVNQPGGADVRVGMTYAPGDSWCGLVCQAPAPRPLIVGDIRRDPRYATHPAAAAFPGLGSYLGVPLLRPDGQVAGTLCACDPEPRPLTARDARLLSVLAQTIATQRERDEEVLARMRAESALQAAHAQFQNIMAHVPGMIFQFVLDRDGHTSLPYVSDGCMDLYGLTPAEAQADPQRIIGLLHPDDRVRWKDTVRISAERMEPWVWEGRLVLPSGEVCWHQGTSRPERQPDGSILWNGMLMDVTERKRAEERLWESETRFQAVVQSARDAIILTDQDGTIIAINRSAEPMFGYSEPEVGGQSVGLLMPDLPPAAVDQASAAGGGAMLEVRGLRKDGSAFPAEVSLANWQTSTARYFSGIIRDISERKQAEAQLRSQAQRLESLSLIDDLTALYNRRGFMTLAEQGLKLSQRTRVPSALLFLDMDGLKLINDTLGHEAGNDALVALAAILKATFREADLIGRLGGDEFVILVANVHGCDLDSLLTRLHTHLAAGSDATPPVSPLAVSVGVVIDDPDAPRPLEALLDQADQLMYAQKRAKLGSVSSNGRQ